jgi:hypothetical protein
LDNNPIVKTNEKAALSSAAFSFVFTIGYCPKAEGVGTSPFIPNC